MDSFSYEEAMAVRLHGWMDVHLGLLLNLGLIQLLKF